MRPDVSDKLVHYVKGTYEEAYQRLVAIIKEKRLLGGDGKIRGGYKCICFTEAPLESTRKGLVNTDAYSRYAPFGLIFDKKWIFEQGGRPVIYQPDNEYELLPESHRWRHVRYEPSGEKPIDFTWEREWRIRSDVLMFDSNVAGILVPDGEWTRRLISEHERENDYTVQMYWVAYGEMAEILREEWKWHVFPLNGSE